MKVAMIEPLSADMMTIRRALKEHDISYTTVAADGNLDETITHSIALSGAVRPAAKNGGIKHMVLRPAVIPGSWLFEPEAERPRLQCPIWYADLLRSVDVTERDQAVASAMSCMEGLGAASAVLGSMMVPPPAEGAQRTIIVAESLRDLVQRLTLDENLQVYFLPDGLHGHGGHEERDIALSTNPEPIDVLFHFADTVLCRDTYLLYEALRRGFKPVVVGEALCDLAGCVHSAPTEDALIAVLRGDPGRWRLDYDSYCAFEAFIACVLCVETIRDSAVGRAEVVRRLRAPDDVPPVRFEIAEARPGATLVQGLSEFLRTPGPWIGDASFYLEQRVRNLLGRYSPRR